MDNALDNQPARRHPSRKCLPGCTCKRHTAQKRYTDEQRAEAYQRKLVQNREYMLRKRLEDPEKHREKARQQYGKHGRKYFLKWKFGLTLERWDEMLVEQSGRCYLCNDPMRPDFIHVDHDRDCCSGNKSCGSCIRGLACQWCNQGVGQFGDDPERMRRIADNLELANAKTRAK